LLFPGLLTARVDFELDEPEAPRKGLSWLPQLYYAIGCGFLNQDPVNRLLWPENTREMAGFS
jgi:hypothetical protein